MGFARVKLLPTLSGYVSDRHCLLPVFVYRIPDSDPSNVDEQMAYYCEGAMDAPDYLDSTPSPVSAAAQAQRHHPHAKSRALSQTISTPLPAAIDMHDNVPNSNCCKRSAGGPTRNSKRRKRKRVPRSQLTQGPQLPPLWHPGRVDSPLPGQKPSNPQARIPQIRGPHQTEHQNTQRH